MTIKAKIFQYSIGPIGSALISLITLPIIAWFYTINDVAKFSIFQAVLLLYTLVFSFGLDQAFIRDYYDENNKNKLLYNVGLGVLIPNLIFIVFVVFFCSESFSYYVYEESSLILTLLTLLSCFLSLSIRLLSSIQRVKDQAVLFSLSQIIPKFIFLILILIFTYFFSKSFYSIIISQFLGLLIVFIYFLIINKNYIINALKEKIDKNLLKSYFIYGLPLIFTGIFIWGLKISDRFYLKFLSNLEQLGLYSMAISIAGAAGIFVSVFNTMWAPLVYRWVNQNDIYAFEIKNKVENIALKASFFVLGISIISIFGSNLVPYFLPIEYDSIRYILPLCILSILLFTLSEITGIGISLVKKTKYTLYSCLIAIIGHIILSIILIPEFGAIGAAVAGVISSFTFLVIRTFFSNNIWLKNNYKMLYFNVFLSVFITICAMLVGGI